MVKHLPVALSILLLISALRTAVSSESKYRSRDSSSGEFERGNVESDFGNRRQTSDNLMRFVNEEDTSMNRRIVRMNRVDDNNRRTVRQPKDNARRMVRHAELKRKTVLEPQTTTDKMTFRSLDSKTKTIADAAVKFVTSFGIGMIVIHIQKHRKQLLSG